jgi:HPt (histidine-containing phosphotransfer) domain-containing protein
MAIEIDEAEVLSRVGGDGELLGELISILGEECERNLGRLSQALKDSDAAAVEHAAHQLKGSLSHFSAPGVTDLAARLEAMGAGEDLNGADAVRNELDPAIEELLSALEALVQRSMT